MNSQGCNWMQIPHVLDWTLRKFVDFALSSQALKIIIPCFLNESVNWENKYEIKEILKINKPINEKKI